MPQLGSVFPFFFKTCPQELFDSRSLLIKRCEFTEGVRPHVTGECLPLQKVSHGYWLGLEHVSDVLHQVLVQRGKLAVDGTKNVNLLEE